MNSPEQRARHAAEQRAWRARHPERAAQQSTASRLRHRETIRAAQREYQLRTKPWTRIDGRARRFAHQANVRAIALGLEGRLTAADVRAIDGPCCYCGAAATGWDHAIPLIRGGQNALSNLVPSCEGCNTAKAHRTPEEFAAGVVVPRPWRSFRSRIGSTLRSERSEIRNAIRLAVDQARSGEDVADVATDALLRLFVVEIAPALRLAEAAP